LNKTRWIIFSVVTVALLAALVTMSGKSSLDVSSLDVNVAQKATNQNGNIAEHVYGKASSKVVLIEYGDFQCSACYAAHPVLKAIKEEYKDQVQFIFRSFPLGSSHPNGRIASVVVEAAGLQGKYWEMYNLVYEKQNDWTNLNNDEFLKVADDYAKQLGLDVKKFRADRQADSKNLGSISKKIDFDKALGLKSKVDATPTLFLNGTKLEGKNWSDFDKSSQELRDVINKELKKAGIPLPTKN